MENALYLSECVDDGSFLNFALTILCPNSWMVNERFEINFYGTGWIVAFETQIESKGSPVIPATFDTVLTRPYFKFF